MCLPPPSARRHGICGHIVFAAVAPLRSDGRCEVGGINTPTYDALGAILRSRHRCVRRSWHKRRLQPGHCWHSPRATAAALAPRTRGPPHTTRKRRRADSWSDPSRRLLRRHRHTHERPAVAAGCRAIQQATHACKRASSLFGYETKMAPRRASLTGLQLAGPPGSVTTALA